MLAIPTLLPEVEGLGTTWHVPRELLALRGLRHECKWFYVQLWQRTRCRPGRVVVDYVADAVSMGGSERGVRRWLATLESLGLLSIERREPRMAVVMVRDWRTAVGRQPERPRRKGPGPQQLDLPLGDEGRPDDGPTTIAMWGTDVARRRRARRTNGPDRPEAG